MKGLKVVLAGLGFGAAFVPIYTHHPDVSQTGIYDPNADLSREVAGKFGINRIYKTFEEILSDDTVDAVHLISPIPCHAQQTLKVLRSGKHCACTVPMATSLKNLKEIVSEVRSSGKIYMMMETSVYTRHFLMASQMLREGQIGHIQFLRGAHYQDMESWPDYWMGLPPMYYGTHAIAPLRMLAGAPIVRTVCFGSGSMREELKNRYGNPFPVESALFEFSNGIKAEATRSLFQTARDYTESFNIYGDKRSFEWQQIEGEGRPVIFTLEKPDGSGTQRGLPVRVQRVQPENYHQLLPEEIRRYTIRSDEYDERNPQLSLEKDASGGHGGSHPHLVHEFIRSIIENRKPQIDEIIGANITAAGICAHESAMQNGMEIKVPDFSADKPE